MKHGAFPLKWDVSSPYARETLAVHKETLTRLTERTVLRSMTPYSLVIRPDIHVVTRCLHLHSKRSEYEGSSFNRNVGNYQTT